jgi:hypothetical protein
MSQPENDNVAEVLLILEALDAAMALAANAQINFARYQEMRDANGGGALTAEQRQELAAESQASIDRL